MTPYSNSEKHKILRLLQNTTGALILIWFVRYLWNNRVIFSQAPDLATTDIVLIVILIIGTWVSTSTQNYLLFRAARSPIRFFESLILTMASVFGNYLPMRIGTVVKAHYLQSIHGLDYVGFASVFSIRLILTMISAGAFGLGALVALLLTENLVSLPLTGILLSFTLGPSLIYFLAPKSTKFHQKTVLSRLIYKFVDGFESLRAQPQIAVMCLLLICLQYTFLAARFVVVSRVIGQPLELSTIFIMVSVTTITNFVAITPGGIGVRESVMGYASVATGTSFSQGLILGSVDRVILLSMVALFGGFSFLYVWLKLNTFKTNVV